MHRLAHSNILRSSALKVADEPSSPRTNWMAAKKLLLPDPFAPTVCKFMNVRKLSLKRDKMSAERFLRHGRFAHTYDVVAWAKRRRFQLVAVDPEALDYHPTYGRHPCRGCGRARGLSAKARPQEASRESLMCSYDDRKVVSGLKRFVSHCEGDAPVELLSPSYLLVKAEAAAR